MSKGSIKDLRNNWSSRWEAWSLKSQYGSSSAPNVVLFWRTRRFLISSTVGTRRPSGICIGSGVTYLWSVLIDCRKYGWLVRTIFNHSFTELKWGINLTRSFLARLFYSYNKSIKSNEAMIFAVMNAIWANWMEKPEKISGLQRGLNPWPRDTGATL